MTSMQPVVIEIDDDEEHVEQKPSKRPRIGEDCISKFQVKREVPSEGAEAVDSENNEILTSDRKIPRILAGDVPGTMEQFLKYCQLLVSGHQDTEDDIMNQVLLYGSAFPELKPIDTSSDEWFHLDDVPGAASQDSTRDLFYNLHEFKRRSQLNGGELMCGIGIARANFVDETSSWRHVWHPIILIQLDITELEGGQLSISPSAIHAPKLWSMSPLCSCDNEQVKIDRIKISAVKAEFTKLLERCPNLSPFDKSSYESFLQMFRVEWQGTAQSAHDEPINCKFVEETAKDAFWNALKTKLQVVDDWIIFTQNGDLSACVRDIHSFSLQLAGPSLAGSAPRWFDFLARKFQDVHYDESSLAPAPLPFETSDWLFPIDSNDQQLDIAEMLARNHTVVVQGPPGTGKTHTLANIVNDALAKGQRVLVVSTGQHALEVFLNKLPNFVRNTAMFFGDSTQAMNLEKVITAVETMRTIVDENRQNQSEIRRNADLDGFQRELKMYRKRQQNLKDQMSQRAELLLRPLSEPVSFERSSTVDSVIDCRLKISNFFKDYDESKLFENLLNIITKVKKIESTELEMQDWLDGPYPPDFQCLKDLVDKALECMQSLLRDDLYSKMKEIQSKILETTQRVIELLLTKNIVENSRTLPGISIIANQFLEQLRSSQGKGRGHHALHWNQAREILHQETVLVKAFPLWIMTTAMAGELLPAQFGLFDIVALDEASKSEIYEIPALLRGKKVLIVGDNKQVSPNDLTMNGRLLHGLQSHRMQITSSSALQASFEPGKSIFDLFYGLHINEVKVLREHFRCAREIIQFCNEKFYDGKLEPLRVSTKCQRMVPQVCCNEHSRCDPNAASHASMPTEDIAREIQQYESMLRGKKNLELSEICTQEKLKKSGSKLELIERLKAKRLSELKGDNSFQEDLATGDVETRTFREAVSLLTSRTAMKNRTLGIIVLGVGQEPVNASKRMMKRLKDRVGDNLFRIHQIRCGGPADFQGDEKDIILAVLLSKQLVNNISIFRWAQAINVAVSRAKERFHLFHSLTNHDIRCFDDDPRRNLVLYCSQFGANGPDADPIPHCIFSLDGILGDLAKKLSYSGIEVRACDVILPREWMNRMLVVEGSERMVAIVLNDGQRQYFEQWRLECAKWFVLSRVGWKILEYWSFQFIMSPDAFVKNVMDDLRKENVMIGQKLPRPLFDLPESALFSGRADFCLRCEELHSDIQFIYVVRPSHEPMDKNVLSSAKERKECVIGQRILVESAGKYRISAIARKVGFCDSDIAEAEFEVLEQVAAPRITLPGAGPFTAASVTVDVSCEAADADIWYTTDGSDPGPRQGRATLLRGHKIVIPRPEDWGSGRPSMELRVVAAQEGKAPSTVSVMNISFGLPAVPSSFHDSPARPSGISSDFEMSETSNIQDDDDDVECDSLPTQPVHVAAPSNSPAPDRSAGSARILIARGNVFSLGEQVQASSQTSELPGGPRNCLIRPGSGEMAVGTSHRVQVPVSADSANRPASHVDHLPGANGGDAKVLAVQTRRPKLEELEIPPKDQISAGHAIPPHSANLRTERSSSEKSGENPSTTAPPATANILSLPGDQTNGCASVETAKLPPSGTLPIKSLMHLIDTEHGGLVCNKGTVKVSCSSPGTFDTADGSHPQPGHSSTSVCGEDGQPSLSSEGAPSLRALACSAIQAPCELSVSGPFRFAWCLLEREGSPAVQIEAPNSCFHFRVGRSENAATGWSRTVNTDRFFGIASPHVSRHHLSVLRFTCPQPGGAKAILIDHSTFGTTVNKVNLKTAGPSAGLQVAGLIANKTVEHFHPTSQELIRDASNSQKWTIELRDGDKIIAGDYTFIARFAS